LRGASATGPASTPCNRAGYDEPLAVGRLERFVGDVAIAQGYAFAPPAIERQERVAIVGGGPSGLSAAFQLRRLGYRVTLIESRGALGGLMRHGIPSYRLARDVLDAEIARVVATGVDVRLNEAIATPQAWRALRAAHDAVYVATGAQRPRRVPSLDYRHAWVVDGAAWLEAANAGTPPALGRRIVVIGGGSAALDVARSARRAGHEVTILALEPRARMPAQREEVDEALEEGIVLRDGAMLVRATTRRRAVWLECTRVRFEAGERGGSFTVTPVEGGMFALAADAIVTSVGQDADLDALHGLPTGRRAGDRRCEPGCSGRAHVGGRRRREPRALRDRGDRAGAAGGVRDRCGAARARRRERRDAGAHDATGTTSRDASVPLAAIATHAHPRVARSAARRRDAVERVAGGDEVQVGLDVAEMLAESARCFSCGTCIGCDGCVVVCPDLAVERTDGGYRVLGDYCKGCGLCVAECPAGAMDMVEEAR
jgi:NADPH-dependent glutamate synthase beta subunit-like oxidoreductase